MILDLFAGLAAKDEALAAHEAKRGDLLHRCRVHLAQKHRATGRPVSADDARAFLDAEGVQKSGAWMGALFKSSEWEMVGWAPSAFPANHGRSIQQWRLKTFAEAA